MFLPDDPTAAVARPAPAAAGTPGWFKDGNPGTGDPATIVDADFLNGLVGELKSICDQAGVALDKTKIDQVLTALGRLGQSHYGSYASDTGAANAYVMALAPAPAAYAAGQEFTFKAANANTGASTLNVNGLGAKPLVRPDGGALQAGDIIVGAMVDVSYDGASFWLSTAQTAVTQAAGDNSTKPATTAFVKSQNYAPLASPALTGAPTAPTQATADNSTKLATTAWANAFVAAGIQGWVQGCIAAVATAMGFAFSFGIAGYLKLPSWLAGFMIQWSHIVSAADGAVISFPTAFPNAGLSVSCTPASTTTNTIGFNVEAVTASNFTVHPNQGNAGTTCGFWFIAIGY